MTDLYAIWDKPFFPSFAASITELEQQRLKLPAHHRVIAGEMLDVLVSNSMLVKVKATGEVKLQLNNISNLLTKCCLYNLFGYRTVGFYPVNGIKPNQRWQLRITIYPGLKASFKNAADLTLVVGNHLQPYLGEIIKVDYQLASPDRFAYMSFDFYTWDYPNVSLAEILYVLDASVGTYTNVLGADFQFVAEGDISEVIEKEKEQFIKEHEKDIKIDKPFDYAKYITSMIVFLVLGILAIKVIPIVATRFKK